MIPKKLYLFGGLSIFALGYCSGSGCSSEPPAIPALNTQQQELVLPPLPPPRTLTSLEQLAYSFAQHDKRLPRDPQPDSFLQSHASSSFSRDLGTLTQKVKTFFRDLYKGAAEEAGNCYEEAKGTLWQSYEGGK